MSINDKVFEVEFYRGAYFEEFKHLTDAQLQNHWQTNGFAEGRISSYTDLFKLIPNDFNYESYKTLNTDLPWNDQLRLTIHYHNHGQYEGRQYNEDNIQDLIEESIPLGWNAEDYFYYNSTITTATSPPTELELKTHWYETGQHIPLQYKISGEAVVNSIDVINPTINTWTLKSRKVGGKDHLDIIQENDNIVATFFEI
jgi:hypothetical protein